MKGQANRNPHEEYCNAIAIKSAVAAVAFTLATVTMAAYTNMPPKENALQTAPVRITAPCGEIETLRPVPAARPAEITAPETEPAETAAETTAAETEAPAPVPEPVTLMSWDAVPLDAALQDHIFTMCDERQIDPALVFAVIWRESTYQAGKTGDNGAAAGLMQVQKRWHADRMERLGCDDLTDPLQNVTVGIDFLDELLDMEKGTEWALMCYNGGFSLANQRKNIGYAEDVLQEAARLAAESMQ